MSFTNCLAADSYEGEISGITVQWSDGAKTRLADDATASGGDSSVLKAATEHFSHSTAVRLGKERVRIMGSLHETTTVSATQEVQDDEPHLSIKVMPGQWKVHIYIDGIGSGKTAFDKLTVKGEGVIKPGNKVPDPSLSTGTLPTPKPKK